MPIGCLSTLPNIIAHMHKLNPQQILDLGIGMGMYGVAIRQWLDGGFNAVGYNPLAKYMSDTHALTSYSDGYRRTIIGVEGFAGYQNPCWELYNSVYKMPIQQYLALDTGLKFNAIIIADVIEHFEKSEGLQVLETLLHRLADYGHLYVATPAIFCEQGAVYANEFERHRSLWYKDDFELLANRFAIDGVQLAVLQDGQPDQFGNLMLTVALSVGRALPGA